MKTFATCCFVLLFSASVFAQPVSKNWDTALLVQGYPVHSSPLSISGIGFNNPSFLSRFNGISAGISYQYGFTIDNAYIGGFTGKSLVNGLPYSAALTYQTGDFHIGAAITQKYNLRIDSGPVETTTVQNPDGTGETGNLIMDRDIHDYSVISSYNIKELPGNNSLSLGLRISLGSLSYCDNNTFGPTPISTETSDYAMAFAFGSDYKFVTGYGDFHLGAYFEKGYGFRKFVHIEFDKKTMSGPDGRVYYLTDPSYNLEISTPDALRFDADYESSNFRFTANMSEIFWKNISEDYKNSLDISAGAIYKTSDVLSLFFDASMNDRKYADNFPNYFSKEYNALFLTMGADAAYGSYTFGLSVSDSHLFSAETRKQTLARLALGYQF